MIDRGGDVGESHASQWVCGEFGDGGRRLMVTQPVQQAGEDGQRTARGRDVPRLEVVADRQGEVVECRPLVSRIATSRCDRTTAIWDSLNRLPLSWATSIARSRARSAMPDRRRGRLNRRREAPARASTGCGWIRLCPTRPSVRAIASSAAPDERQRHQSRPRGCVHGLSSCVRVDAEPRRPSVAADRRVYRDRRAPTRVSKRKLSKRFVTYEALTHLAVAEQHSRSGRS